MHIIANIIRFINEVGVCSPPITSLFVVVYMMYPIYDAPNNAIGNSILKNFILFLISFCFIGCKSEPRYTAEEWEVMQEEEKIVEEQRQEEEKYTKEEWEEKQSQEEQQE